MRRISWFFHYFLFSTLNVGATNGTGKEPVTGRVHIAVEPEISSWME
ncbi:MAG: hypothetical protein HZA90_27025 [Verrucomicrobia bacterium]|nr:hypothetical protein [Verrucomicrobiota bacterium]